MADFRPSFGRSFAILVPLSRPAHAALQLPHNSRLLGWKSQILPCPLALPDRQVVVVDVATLLGRTCFSVGSSRLCDLLLPESDDVSSHHFKLYLNADRKWQVEDTSIQAFRASGPASSHPLSPPQTYIEFGAEGRFQFRLIINSAIDHAYLAAYVQSIGPSPLDIAHHQRKRPAEPCSPSETHKRQRYGSETKVSLQESALEGEEGHHASGFFGGVWRWITSV